MTQDGADRDRFKGHLRPLRKKYLQARARVQEVGLVVRGSIDRRRLQCGQPSCRCQQDPSRWHGPYYLITWKEGGKTVCRVLPPAVVPLFREWISNARALDRILDQMRTISRDAADAVRTEEAKRVKAARASKAPGNRR